MSYSGFDIDFCRVIAAAVLGDAEAVEYVPLTAEQRFTSLASGEIDVLVRNTTWTASRDGTENAAFVTTTFYDGQGMMVHGGLRDRVARRHGRRDRVRALGHHHRAEPGHRVQRPGLSFEPLTFDEVDQIREAILAGPVRRLDVRPLPAGRRSDPPGPRPRVGPRGS